MCEVVIEIPDGLKEEITKHSGIEWSEVFEKAIRRELSERAKREIILTALNKLFENSTLTEEDCLRLGEKVKEGMYKRYKEEGLL